jgi:hypothetical protein
LPIDGSFYLNIDPEASGLIVEYFTSGLRYRLKM